VVNTKKHTHRTDDKRKYVVFYSLSRKKVRHGHLRTKEIVRRLFTKKKKERKGNMGLLTDRSISHKKNIYISECN
jgi:hypothetical protein